MVKSSSAEISKFLQLMREPGSIIDGFASSSRICSDPLFDEFAIEGLFDLVPASGVVFGLTSTQTHTFTRTAV